MLISSPGLASHRKLEQMPFLAGSLAFNSGSQYSARRTHSDVVLPSNLSPYLLAAMEYRRTPWGISLPLELILVPCSTDVALSSASNHICSVCQAQCS